MPGLDFQCHIKRSPCSANELASPVAQSQGLFANQRSGWARPEQHESHRWHV